MSSNSVAPKLIRLAVVAGLVSGLAACASMGGKDAPVPATTATQQYQLRATHAPDEILLATHDTGLSANQAAALSQLVAQWRESGSDTLTIKAPTAGGDQAYRMVAAIQARLEILGVDPDVVHLIGYDPGQPGPAPVVVGFERYQAVVDSCNRSWGSLTHTINNEVDPNFGCAVTANMAAMVANPADLAHPAAMTDVDAARREVVLGKYRTGGQTSSTKDSQSDGSISNAVQ